MSETENNLDFFWDVVFFKVENEIFCVPRCEFEQSSEIFADMFRLPSVNPEGGDKEHPIVLEGYNSEEFTCLLKVMYPTASSLISGANLGLQLSKQEWVNVLKLSTIWNMHKIREHAIHRLSTETTLSQVEKVQLARAHKVTQWLEEGLKSLAEGEYKMTREDMATLGWETSALILWIGNQVLSRDPDGPLRFTRDSIKCVNCWSSASLFSGARNCYNCSQILAEDEELSFPNAGSVLGSDRSIPVRGIKCSRCSGSPFHSFSNVRCSSCSYTTQPHLNVRITPKKSSTDMINEVFKQEIEESRFSSFTL